MARTPERCPRRSRAGGERSGTVSGARRAASEPKEKTTLRSSGSSRAGARERGEEAEQALSGAAWARREAEVVGDEAYFGAGEEVAALDDLARDAGLGEGSKDRTRLGPAADEDGARGRFGSILYEGLYTAGDFASFRCVRDTSEGVYMSSRCAFSREQYLGLVGAALGVDGPCYVVGEGEDAFSGAEVDGEGKGAAADVYAGLFFEALDVAHGGAGEVVDALQVVADDDHFGEITACKELDETELGRVGVLELVDDDELVAVRVGLAHYGVFEDSGAEFDHVLVAQEAAGGASDLESLRELDQVEAFLEDPEEPVRVCAGEVFFGPALQCPQVHEVVLGLREQCQDFVRGTGGIREVEPAQREVSCGELVEDHEPGPATTQDRGIWFQIEHGGVLAHYLEGVGVKVSDGQLEGLFSEAGDEAGAHLVRGLNGEGEGEDALGRRAP